MALEFADISPLMRGKRDQLIQIGRQSWLDREQRPAAPAYPTHPFWVHSPPALSDLPQTSPNRRHRDP
jgi:hypothetical protein